MSVKCGKCKKGLKNKISLTWGYGPICRQGMMRAVFMDSDLKETQSEYIYHFKTYLKSDQVLVIENRSPSETNVTSSIKAIINHIAGKEGEHIYSMPIVYKDSEGIFDGINGQVINTNSAPFYSINTRDETQAMKIANQCAKGERGPWD